MQEKKPIIAIIPARYESVRFPGKPLVEILGKTLIQRTYENTTLCKELDEVLVATEDQRIYDHFKHFGGHVVMTPSMLLITKLVETGPGETGLVIVLFFLKTCNHKIILLLSQQNNKFPTSLPLQKNYKLCYYLFMV